MAARKKTATRKKSSAARAGKAKRKKVTRTKATARKATKKKAAKKKVARKKVAKKTTRKKAAAKKTTRKKTSGKKATRKKAAKKKVARKKAPAKKKVAAKKKAKKKPAARKVTRKNTVARKVAKKKPASKPVRRKTARRGSLLSGPSTEFKPYARTRGESYMNDAQLEHFKEKLLSWKRELMEEVDRTVHHMKDEAANFPDPNDRATQESEFSLELRTRDRERKLLRKIDSALQRIKDGSYGYCEETGEEIGLKRLEARPVATLCLEAQERRELAEKQYRDDR